MKLTKKNGIGRECEDKLSTNFVSCGRVPPFLRPQHLLLSPNRFSKFGLELDSDNGATILFENNTFLQDVERATSTATKDLFALHFALPELKSRAIPIIIIFFPRTHWSLSNRMPQMEPRARWHSITCCVERRRWRRRYRIQTDIWHECCINL